MNELEHGRKDIAATLETPLADYALLHRSISEGMVHSEMREYALHLLYRLRPRGTRITVAVLVEQGGLVLGVTRKSDKSKVCFPGGHVDACDFRQKQGFTSQIEDMLEAAAVRELQEETGIYVYGLKMTFSTMDECGNLCTMFRTKFLGRPETKPEPGTECLWLTPDEFMARCAWPAYYRAARAAEVF